MNTAEFIELQALTRRRINTYGRAAVLAVLKRFDNAHRLSQVASADRAALKVALETMTVEVKLPPVKEQLGEWEKAMQPSDFVLCRVANSTIRTKMGIPEVQLGCYYHGFKEWRVDAMPNFPANVVEWWELPLAGTGITVPQ